MKKNMKKTGENKSIKMNKEIEEMKRKDVTYKKRKEGRKDSKENKRIV